jgi:DNA ligase (NAD+)
VHLFSWLTLSETQLQQTPGISTERARQVWHKFDLAKQQPFTQWLQAMGMPLNQKALPSLAGLTWQQLVQMKQAEWQTLPMTGKTKASQLMRWLDDSHVNTLAQRLAEQGIAGFKN